MTGNNRVSIGMLRSRNGPDATALAGAHAALMQGAKFFFFNPEDVDLAARTIQGRFYEGDAWVRRETAFPDVVENDTFVTRLPELWPALVGSCRVTTPRLGGKLEVDRRMRSVGAFADLLIPTTNAETVDVLLAQIAEHGAVVVKPIFGALGRDVIFVERDGDGFRANLGGGTLRMSETGLRDFYARKVGGRGYLIQKYIVSRTRQNLPFDMRIHVRRGGRAEWELIRIWGRIGSGRGITSNTSAGGSGSGGLELLANIYGAEAKRLYDALLQLTDTFPPMFQSLYPDRAIDALGLDVGLGPDGKPWLFEVNVYPSAQWCEIEDAVSRIGYAIYLANNPDCQDGAVRVR